MKIMNFFGLAVLFMTMHTTQVFAHTLWKPGSITPPRSTDKFANLKVGPCGGASAQNLLPRGTKPKIFRTGESITVEWIETINHVGLFLFNQLDNTNTAIPQFIIDNTPAGINEVSVVDPDDGSLSGGEKLRIKTLTLPTTECAECTLQIIQEMWPFNATQRPTVASGDRTYYYSCSDIRIELNNNAVPGEITFPTTQARIDNINNIVLNWINPSEIDKTPTGLSNVAYRVLILQSDSRIFATPMDGTQYDLITDNTVGNAKVVYDGNLETATLSPLPNTPADKQYFKLFTYNVSNLYSQGVESSPVPAGQVTPIINLSLSQGNLINPTEFIRTNGMITTTATITNAVLGDTYTYDWSRSNSQLVDQTINKTDEVFQFDPSTLDIGNYSIILTATSATSGLASANKNMTIKIVAQATATTNNGTTAGGCSVTNNGKFDPILLLLVLLSIASIGVRTRKQIVKLSK